ncbi:recombinase family protein [Bacillus sp. ChL18]|uniref:recombinase family protein n=1 Tax=Bacillus TaxID=1386 RepID=UPI002248A3F0|nr:MULTISPECIES: recombinase family protein [Bacillus]MCX2810557.1 recombinase family protein [Bacillus sp. ChL18]MDI6564255.1 recombinase family protein [Bacillus subtilis]
MELKNKIKRVAIYLRKSRNKEGEETEETLAKHRKRLLDIAHKNNWQYEIFQEVGSSMDEMRPEYQRMINKLTDGIFDAVLSVNLARVTRDDAETPKFMNLLRQDDILFVTDSERVYDLEVQEDWQALKFTGFVNNWEYENIKAQLRKGKKDSAKMGRWSNGTPNYGYIYNRLERKLEIDEEKAKAVKLAFQMTIDGIGADNIAVKLNKLGYRTNNGKFFHGQSIVRMIRSEIYKGWIVANRLKGRNKTNGKIRPQDQWIVVKDAVKPCIIDEDTWDKANKALDKRKLLNPRAKMRKHGLSSLIVCGLCGRTHSVTIRKDRNNMRVIQSCRKRNPLGEKCINGGIQYNIMMELIINNIRMKKDQIQLELEKLKDENEAIDTTEIEIQSIKQQIKKVEKALQMLQLQLEEDLISLSDFKERKTIRSIELDNLQKELTKLKETSKEDKIKYKESFIEYLDHFLNNWSELDESQLNNELMSFIKKIIWYHPIGNNKEHREIKIDWAE